MWGPHVLWRGPNWNTFFFVKKLTSHSYSQKKKKKKHHMVTCPKPFKKWMRNLLLKCPLEHLLLLLLFFIVLQITWMEFKVIKPMSLDGKEIRHFINYILMGIGPCVLSNIK